MKEFFQKIKLRAHFSYEEEKHEGEQENGEHLEEERIFRKKSKWTPHNVHHTVETFIEAVKKDIYSTPKVSLPRNNLSRNGIEAMNDLKQRTDIIITKADKRGAVVIIDVKDYIKEADRQLGNTQFYHIVEDDLTDKHNKMVNVTIDKCTVEKSIPAKIGQALKARNPKTPRFCMLLKVHKPNNPGRPVVSSVACQP